jgi:hypothetical protein
MAAVDVLREWAVRDVAIGGVAVSSILFRTGSDSSVKSASIGIYIKRAKSWQL